MRGILFTIILAGTASAAVPPQVLPSDRPTAAFWVPNRAVSVLAERDGILYAGGAFDRVGPHSGPLALLDAGDASLLSAAFPALDGTVLDVEADGAGGWFVAGTFTQVGDQHRQGVVRFAADGSLSPWDPGVRGTVRALLRVGPTLYLAGPFDVAQGARAWLAAVDVDSGALRAWDPRAGSTPADWFQPGDELLDLAQVENRILVAGHFERVRIGGAERSHLTALDATSGAARPAPRVNGRVAAIAALEGTALIAGAFTTVNGAERPRLAWVRGRRVLPHRFPAPDRELTALAIAGKTVYLGGRFTFVDGERRAHLAAVDLVTKQLLPWDPALTEATATGDWVEELAIDGSTLLVAGGFQRIAGEARQSLAAIDRITGVVRAWDGRVAGEPGSTFVRALEVEGGRVAVGGNFTVANTVPRGGLAAYDLASGSLLPWAPEAVGVQALAFDGPRVFVGGTFGQVNHTPRPRLAVVDAASGALDLAFDAQLCTNSGNVSRLAFDGVRLFVVGSVSPCGQNERRLSVLDPYTGARLGGLEPFLSSSVRAAELSGDGLTLYLGGSFVEVGDPVHGYQARTRLAALDTSTATFTSWAPAAMGDVHDLLLLPGRLLVGGAFTSLNGQAQQYLAELDPFSGLLAGWNPGPEDSVSRLASDGEITYLIGSFELVDGEDVPMLAAVDAEDGTVLDWRPGPLSGTGTMLWTERGLVVAGGPSYGKGVVHHLALFALPAPLAGDARPAGAGPGSVAGARRHP